MMQRLAKMSAKNVNAAHAGATEAEQPRLQEHAPAADASAMLGVLVAAEKEENPPFHYRLPSGSRHSFDDSTHSGAETHAAQTPRESGSPPLSVSGTPLKDNIGADALVKEVQARSVRCRREQADEFADILFQPHIQSFPFVIPILDGVTGLPHKLVANRDIEGVVGLLSSESDLAFHMQVMYAVRNYAVSDEASRRRITECRGVELILASMNLHKGEDEQHAILQELAIWALWNLAQSQVTRVKIASTNVLPLVLDAMLTHSKWPGVQEQGCWMLVWLCWQDVHSKQRARLLGAQNLVYSAMIEHPTHPGVQRYAQECLKHLDDGY